jgi:hypothetical protein
MRVGTPATTTVTRNFIRSFTTLEELELDDVFINVNELDAHPDLESIVMHGGNYPTYSSFALSDSRIKRLGLKCPQIRYVELDFAMDGKRVSPSSPSLPSDHE